MEKLEQKILNQFIKHEGDGVKGLDLIVCMTPDCWPDDDNVYCCEVMETQDNGRVWECECTKSGNIKDIYEIS